MDRDASANDNEDAESNMDSLDVGSHKGFDLAYCARRNGKRVVERIDSRGGRPPEQILEIAAGAYCTFAPSPRADAIAWLSFDYDVSRWILYESSLPEIAPVRLSDLNIYGTPDWSPNGKKIAFVGEKDNSHYGIYVVAKDGSSTQHLDSVIPAGGPGCIHPEWSPRGNAVVYSGGEGFDGTSWHSSLYTYDVRHGERHTIFEGGPSISNVCGATWSPSGKQVAFTVFDANTARWTLMVVPSKGGEPTLQRAINGGPSGNQHHWSPSGDELVFVEYNYSKGQGEVLRVDVASGKETFLVSTNTGVMDSAPRWSPDGRSIALSVYANEDDTVTVAPVDGTPPRHLIGTDAGLGTAQPRWIRRR